MYTQLRGSIIRRFFSLGVAVVAALFVANTAAVAQSGGGGCQRGGGGGGPYGGGPPPGMGNPSGFSRQNMGGPRGSGPVARSAPPTRAELLAQQKAYITKFRERQASLRAANASRLKSKTVKPSSNSPTA